MSRFKHSCVLFVDPLGEPLEFYMRPCVARFTVMQMIRHGGGIFSNNGGADIIRLVEPGTKVLNVFDGEQVLSVQYIYDCVDKNVLLDTKPYVVAVTSIETSDISDDDDRVFNIVPPPASAELSSQDKRKIVDYVLSHGDEFRRTFLADFCSQLGTIMNKNSTFISSYLHHLAKCKESATLSSFKLRDFKKLWTSKNRACYSLEDDLSMLNYIIRNNLYPRIHQLSLFREMADDKVTPYSYISMKNRFTNRVLVNLEEYDIPEEAKCQFARHCKKSSKLEKRSSNSRTPKEGQVTKRGRSVNGADHESSSTASSKSSPQRKKKVKFADRSKRNVVHTEDPILKSPVKLVNVRGEINNCVSSMTLIKDEPTDSIPDEEVMHVEETLENQPDGRDITPTASPRQNRLESSWVLPSVSSSEEDAFSPVALRKIHTAKELLESVENAMLSASPVLRSPTPSSSANKAVELDNGTAFDIDSDAPQEAAGRESPSLVPVAKGYKKRKTVKLYNPNLCMLSLPDTDSDFGIFDAVKQLAEPPTKPDSSNGSSSEYGDASCISPTNNSNNEYLAVEKVQTPKRLSVSRDSTPDRLDNYDRSLLNILEGRSNQSPLMGENMSSEESESNEHNCTVIERSEMSHTNSSFALEYADSRSDVNEKEASSAGSVSEDRERCISPLRSDASDYGEQVRSEGSANANREHYTSPSESYASDHDEQERTEGSADANREHCTSPSESYASDHDEQERTEAQKESLFMSEATVITYKIEKMVSSFRNTHKKKNLMSDIQKLKQRMYKQFLEIHVKEILRKPELSRNEKALLTKYLAHCFETTPEDILFEKCGTQQS